MVRLRTSIRSACGCGFEPGRAPDARGAADGGSIQLNRLDPRNSFQYNLAAVEGRADADDIGLATIWR
jgi:hypothetical protein